MLLVVTAVDAERDAVVRDLGPCDHITINGMPAVSVDTPAGTLHAISSGVGPVAAATTTAFALATARYEFVASAGIAGGFRDRIAVGEIAVAAEVTFADLGVRTDDGFLTPRDMGLPQESSYAVAGEAVVARLLGGSTVVTHGAILTLACMTGTKTDAEQLAARFPRAIAEAMEGFGVVDAAIRAPNSPSHVTEIRAISNLIGQRDRSAWDLPAAFEALSAAFATLVKEPFDD
ncbi:MAG: futalosine hydrolase [Acidothermaceae bacterium]